MATANAARQAAFRQRRDDRIRKMAEALRNQGSDGEVATLRRELAQDRRTLEWAMDAIKMLKAQNKRLRNGESMEEPRQESATLALPDLDLDGANDEGRELYETAPAEVKTWLKSFAVLPRKDAKGAYSLFLYLAAVGALPMGKAKPRKRAVT